MLTAGLACAADPGQVPDAALASFGLGGMHQMTDAQGTAIRGKGFALVTGCISTSAGGASNWFNYVAVSDPRQGSAVVAVSVQSVAISSSNTSTTGAQSTSCLTVSGAYAFGCATVCAK
jgi:hypothetical protein